MDIQIAGQYVVSALRTMSKASGREVDVISWSQGGMVPRWALRFWPDTRTLVDDVIGISYTVAYTGSDEVVVPDVGPTASSALRTGDGLISNVPLQQVCPTDTADHFAIGSYDAVGWATALDAPTHTGPAVPARISPTVCLQPVTPGVDPATFPTDDAAFTTYATNSDGDATKVPAEPTPAPYVVPTR